MRCQGPPPDFSRCDSPCVRGLFSSACAKSQAQPFGLVQDAQAGSPGCSRATITSVTQGNTLTVMVACFVFPISVCSCSMDTLQVTLTGFKTAERTNLVVRVHDQVCPFRRLEAR